MANTILEKLQEKYPNAEGINDARNIAEAVACISGKGGRGANAIADAFPKKFTVSFDIKRGTGTTPETMYVTEGESITLPSADGITPPAGSTGFGEWYSPNYKVSVKPGQAFKPISDTVFNAIYRYEGSL